MDVLTGLWVLTIGVVSIGSAAVAWGKRDAGPKPAAQDVPMELKEFVAVRGPRSCQDTLRVLSQDESITGVVILCIHEDGKRFTYNRANTSVMEETYMLKCFDLMVGDKMRA